MLRQSQVAEFDGRIHAPFLTGQDRVVDCCATDLISLGALLGTDIDSSRDLRRALSDAGQLQQRFAISLLMANPVGKDMLLNYGLEELVMFHPEDGPSEVLLSVIDRFFAVLCEN